MGFFGGGGAAPANMGGATSSAAGTAGLVPAPAAGKESEFLTGGATFSAATVEYLTTTRKVKSGELVSFDFGGQTGNKSLANGFIQWSCVYIPKTKSYSNVAIKVTTLASNTKIKIGLYSISTSGEPDVFQFETGEIDSSTTGLKTISITPITLNAGWYIAAVRSNGAPAVLGVQNRVPARQTRGLGVTQLDYSTTTYANALPSPWSGSTVEADVFNSAVEIY